MLQNLGWQKTCGLSGEINRLAEACGRTSDRISNLLKCFQGAIAAVLSITLVAVAFPLPADDAPRPDHSRVPGVAIAHSPAASGIYIGSPGILIVPDGSYLTFHRFENFRDLTIADSVGTLSKP